MHTTESTYSTITEDEEESYEKWLQQRDIAYLHSIKLNHYFFHMEKAGYDFYHQVESSTTTQMSSDLVEQPKEVNEEKKENLSNRILFI